MEPGDRIIGRSAYQTRQYSAGEVRAVMRVTQGGSLRLTSGVLERAEYWRVATPAEVAAWDAAVAAQAAADVVAGHMAGCPQTRAGYGLQALDTVRRRAAAVLAWAGRLAPLQAQLEAAMGAASVALEACQPAAPKGAP
jgi:hypothetical protein